MSAIQEKRTGGQPTADVGLPAVVTTASRVSAPIQIEVPDDAIYVRKVELGTSTGTIVFPTGIRRISTTLSLQPPDIQPQELGVTCRTENCEMVEKRRVMRGGSIIVGSLSTIVAVAALLSGTTFVHPIILIPALLGSIVILGMSRLEA